MRRRSLMLAGCLLAAVHGKALAQTPPSGELHAVTGAVVYASPESAPIEDGVVLMRAGRIVAAGSRAAVELPTGAITLDGTGLFAVAGFQNSHVHFTEVKWNDVAVLPAARLSADLDAMLLRWGFTTVVDTGSTPANTLALRRRVETGEVAGPRILTTGAPLYPDKAIPYYLRQTLPAAVLALLPTPTTEVEAAAMAASTFDAGADAIKLFTGSWVERGRVKPMPAPIARAAADEAHARGKLVFAHASNVDGLDCALEAGVDVLAHALDDESGWDDARMARMLSAGVALIPTLKLFAGHPHAADIRHKVGDFARAGGQVLFGTDAGYLTDYDPTQEYALMAAAGFGWRQILSSLTTAPSARFGEATRRGKLEPGMDADLVLLSTDPAVDPTAFASVKYTLRGGRLLHADGQRPNR